MRRVISMTASLFFLLALAPASAPAMSHEVFETECAKCHGDAGDADTPVGKAMKIPSFVGSDWADAEPGAICETIRNNPKHKSVVSKLDEEALMAACRKVKELAGGEG